MPRKKKEPEVKLPAVTQLPSGKFRVRIMIDGTSHSIVKDTPEQCIAEYIALKHGVMEATKAPPKKKCKTLSTAVDEYIASREGKRSPATIYGYKKDKRNTFQSAMGYNVYTTTDAQWQAAIDDEKRLGRSNKYIKNAWSLMAASIEATTGKRPDVMLFPPESNERQWLDHEQIDAFVKAVKGQPVEIAALLCLSSLRRSEVLALKWINVDLKKNVIYVHGAKVRGENGLEEKKQNKTDKSRRTVPIIPPLREALESAPRNGEYVVTMSQVTMLRHVNRICAENGLPEVGLHGLRHSFASLAYHLQIPEMIAAQIGGWKDLGTMHKIYTHIAEADIARRSQDFCNYFSPRPDPKEPNFDTAFDTL